MTARIFIAAIVLAVWARSKVEVLAKPENRLNKALSEETECSGNTNTLHLPSPPYDNYFYSDCHTTTQVVVTSPQPDSNLSLIGPRLLVAWPAGNSGIAAFFQPENGVNGSLDIDLTNNTNLFPLAPFYEPSATGSLHGVQGLIEFNSSAVLNLAILGSVRSIRDFTESGASTLDTQVQDAVHYVPQIDGGALVSRVWLDNVTTTNLTFMPTDSNTPFVNAADRALKLGPGTYNFTAFLSYPQLTRLAPNEVLQPESTWLTSQYPDQTTSLSFLSTTDKFLAGAWRFLTYFGRDTLIFLLLAQPIISDVATEAILSSVFERINGTTGSVCHEETIGDYATYQNLQRNISSTAPSCSYIMVDSDYYLPIAMANYYAASPDSARALLSKTATTAFGNTGVHYSSLLNLNAKRIVENAAAFAAPGNQTKENLQHLESDQEVGQWRDSTYGIGGGRIPLDVNTALVPAALYATAKISAAGLVDSSWEDKANSYATVWENATLPFFEVTENVLDARDLVTDYVRKSMFAGPSGVEHITEPVSYYALSLDGNNNQSAVKVMNTDVCFRLFLLNSTDNKQFTDLVNSTATNILSPFPAGLSTDTGLLISNPAYGSDPIYAANWTTEAYHGTVVWSWPMAMMAKGLEQKLNSCDVEGRRAFCEDQTVYENVKAAYNHLWDIIEANTMHLTTELWAWEYIQGSGFVFKDYSLLSNTESDIRQLWSLVYLAVTRNEAYR